MLLRVEPHGLFSWLFLNSCSLRPFLLSILLFLPSLTSGASSSARLSLIRSGLALQQSRCAIRGPGLSRPGLAEELRALEERHARYTPVLRFTLLDPKQRRFGAQRMSSLGGIDEWLELGQTGPAAKLARKLIPTLGTEQFFELW